MPYIQNVLAPILIVRFECDMVAPIALACSNYLVLFYMIILPEIRKLNDISKTKMSNIYIWVQALGYGGSDSLELAT